MATASSAMGRKRMKLFSLHFAKHFALFRRRCPTFLRKEALSPSFHFLHISTAAKLSFMLNFISVFRLLNFPRDFFDGTIDA